MPKLRRRRLNAPTHHKIVKTRRPQRLHHAAEIRDAGECLFAIVFQLELDAKTQKAFGGLNVALGFLSFKRNRFGRGHFYFGAQVRQDGKTKQSSCVLLLSTLLFTILTCLSLNKLKYWFKRGLNESVLEEKHRPEQRMWALGISCLPCAKAF